MHDAPGIQPILLSNVAPSDCLVDIELIQRVDFLLFEGRNRGVYTGWNQELPDLLLDLSNLLEALVFHDRLLVIQEEFDDRRAGLLLHALVEHDLVRRLRPTDVEPLITADTLSHFCSPSGINQLGLSPGYAAECLDGVRSDDMYYTTLVARDDLPGHDFDRLFGVYGALYRAFKDASAQTTPDRASLLTTLRQLLYDHRDTPGERTLLRTIPQSVVASAIGLQYRQDVGHEIVDAVLKTPRILLDKPDYAALSRATEALLRDVYRSGSNYAVPLPPLSLIFLDRLRARALDRAIDFWWEHLVQLVLDLRAEASEYRASLTAYLRSIHSPEDLTLGRLKDMKEATLDECADLMRRMALETRAAAVFRDVLWARVSDEPPEGAVSAAFSGFRAAGDLRIMHRHAWVFKLTNSLSHLRLDPHLIDTAFGAPRRLLSRDDVDGMLRVRDAIETLWESD